MSLRLRARADGSPRARRLLRTRQGEARARRLDGGGAAQKVRHPGGRAAGEPREGGEARPTRGRAAHRTCSRLPDDCAAAETKKTDPSADAPPLTGEAYEGAPSSSTRSLEWCVNARFLWRARGVRARARRRGAAAGRGQQEGVHGGRPGGALPRDARREGGEGRKARPGREGADQVGVRGEEDAVRRGGRFGFGPRGGGATAGRAPRREKRSLDAGRARARAKPGAPAEETGLQGEVREEGEERGLRAFGTRSPRRRRRRRARGRPSRASGRRCRARAVGGSTWLVVLDGAPPLDDPRRDAGSATRGWRRRRRQRPAPSPRPPVRLLLHLHRARLVARAVIDGRTRARALHQPPRCGGSAPSPSRSPPPPRATSTLCANPAAAASTTRSGAASFAASARSATVFPRSSSSFASSSARRGGPLVEADAERRAGRARRRGDAGTEPAPRASPRARRRGALSALSRARRRARRQPRPRLAATASRTSGRRARTGRILPGAREVEGSYATLSAMVGVSSICLALRRPISAAISCACARLRASRRRRRDA